MDLDLREFEAGDIEASIANGNKSANATRVECHFRLRIASHAESLVAHHAMFTSRRDDPANTKATRSKRQSILLLQFEPVHQPPTKLCR
jgi:hypothetical protein